MLQKTKKAVVTTVKVSHIEFEGLMLPNGGYAIAISQLDALGLIRQNKASKDLKALLGNSFQLDKTISELNPRAVNIISLSDFKKLLIKLDRKGNRKPDSKLRDNERIPLSENIEEYFDREVSPHLPESWMDRKKDKVGYEINFTKYFYKYKPLRSSEEITRDLFELDKESENLLNQIMD